MKEKKTYLVCGKEIQKERKTQNNKKYSIIDLQYYGNNELINIIMDLQKN
jgi:hypothetical protein